MRWRYLDAFTWSLQLSEKDAYLAWQQSHPGGSKLLYTNCRDIKEFWRSPIGRLIYGIYSINSQIAAIARNPIRKLRYWNWCVRFNRS
jgi:hypothetical protein